MERTDQPAMPHRALAVLRGVVALLLGAFFGFVGWMKSFAPLATLAEHHAWTVWLPEWLGRLVGVSELACAAALVLPVVVPRWRPAQQVAALVLIVNQVVAAGFHLANGEAAALPQNAVLIALLLLVAAARRRPVATLRPYPESR